VDAATGSDASAGTLGTPLRTIQAAINAVVAGGTVNVAAGTYAENLSISKSLSLVGPNASVAALSGSARGAEAIVGADNTAQRVTLSGSAPNVTISGFKFVGTASGTGSPGISVAGGGSGTISNNWFDSLSNTVLGSLNGANYVSPFSNSDIYIQNGSAGIYTISGNQFDGSATGDPGDGPYGYSAINAWYLNDVTITGNRIENYPFSGMQLEGTKKATITGNFVKNVAANGIQVANGATTGPVLIQGNTVDHASAAYQSYWGADPIDADYCWAGIRIWQTSNSAAGVTEVSNNKIINTPGRCGAIGFTGRTQQTITKIENNSMDSSNAEGLMWVNYAARATSIASNVATVRLWSNTGDIGAGDSVTITDLGAPFDGTKTVTAVGTWTDADGYVYKTVSFAVSAADQALTNVAKGAVVPAYRVAAPVSAANNWWGAGSGPGSVGASLNSAGAGATTAPWIFSFTPDPAKAGQPGFWPTAAKTLLKVNAASANKTYDAGTSASGTPTVNPTTPLPAGYTLSGCVQTYASKNAGIQSITASSCKVRNAGSSDVSSGYEIEYAAGTGTISPAPLTISAVADSKAFNASAASSGQPTVSGLLGSDTVTGRVQVFDSAAVGSRTLSVSAYTVNDGNSGGNYSTPTLQTAAGTITQGGLIINAVPANKTYDAGTSGSGTPTVDPTTPLPAGYSLSGCVQTYASKNAGTRSITASSCTVRNAASSDVSSQFSVTYTTSSGVISKRSLTISAVVDTKAYDGTTASAGAPSVSGLQGSDTVTGRVQVFGSPNATAVSGASLSVSTYTVNDGNSGNNYSVSTPTASGTINKASTALVTATPAATKTGKAVTLSATLTNTSAGNAPVPSATIGMNVCSPTNICTAFYPVTNASGVASVSYTPAGEAGDYTVVSYIFATSNLFGSTAPTVALTVFGYETTVVATAAASQYRGGIVVTGTLKYKNGTSASPLSGQSVKYYLMPNATETNVANGQLIGTATSNSSGVSSVLYRMDSLSSPPAVGSRLNFVAKFNGSTPSGAFGGSQSTSALSPGITKRGTGLTGTAVKSGTNVALNITIKESNLSLGTSSAGVVTTTTITGAGLVGVNLTFQWLNAAGSAIGAQFTSVTNSSGVVSTTRAIPTGAAKVRVKFAATASDLAATNLELTL